MDFWLRRFDDIAGFMEKYEAENQAVASYAEIRGQIEIDGFTLFATADRIDVYADGGASVIDYKTGAPPSKREVENLFAPQLPIEAMILDGDGFPGVKARAAGIKYINLNALSTREIADVDRILSLTRGKIRATIKAFDRKETPYISRPNLLALAKSAEEYDDYAHLARIGEWEGSV
jgi:ATP-dependent helicase/nuclease subunit B